MRIIVSTLLLSSVVVVSTSQAFADVTTTKLPFAMMDSSGEGSGFNIDLASVLPPDLFGGVLVRPRFFAQHITPSGFGGYASINSYGAIGSDVSAQAWSFGNLELGGLYRYSSSPNTDLGVRIGFVLPTASGDDGFAAFAQEWLTLRTRPQDYVTSIPHQAFLRVGFSPTTRREGAILRTDIGLDIPLTAHPVDHPLGHVNFGLGFGEDGFSVALEVQNLVGYDDNEIRIYSAVGVTGRYRGQGASPFVSVSKSAGSDRFASDSDVTVTVGLTTPL